MFVESILISHVSVVEMSSGQVSSSLYGEVALLAVIMWNRRPSVEAHRQHALCSCAHSYLHLPSRLSPLPSLQASDTYSCSYSVTCQAERQIGLDSYHTSCELLFPIPASTKRKGARRSELLNEICLSFRTGRHGSLTKQHVFFAVSMMQALRCRANAGPFYRNCLGSFPCPRRISWARSSHSLWNGTRFRCHLSE